MSVCDGCGGPFLEGQGTRFETVPPFGAYHDDCWPHICCAECGYVGDVACYCITENGLDVSEDDLLQAEIDARSYYP